MLKDTVEICRYKKHILGYGIMGNTPSENSEDVLDKLIEWSRKNNFKVYKHKLRYVEENIDFNGPKYHYSNPNCKPAEIPYCDLVYYLDIYYQ